VIGLRDLVVPEARSWEDAQERFSWPAVDRYNIAADCLRGPGDRPALIVVDGSATVTVTVAELDDASGRLAAALLELGVRAGDRVAVKLSQSREMAVTILAALRAGAVMVPVSNVLGHDGALHRLNDSLPRLLVAAGTDEERAALLLAESATRISDRTDAVSDSVWDEASRHLDQASLAAVLTQVAVTNFWNHLNVPIRQGPASGR
jgi:acyl-coenzyme A synthetase/AMP-(fatty) acid ligase